MKLTFDVPIKATFTLNSREHWAARARKRKRERSVTALFMRAAYRKAHPYFAPLPHPRGFMPPWAELKVTLTRIGPRKLDSDNVQGALKAVRDEVAAQFGVDDGDPRITWEYAQETGPYSVRVCIEVATGRAA